MKTQCTFFLTGETVEHIRRLVEEQQVAPSQDDLVERALSYFFMLVQQEHENEAVVDAEREAMFQGLIDRLARELIDAAERGCWSEEHTSDAGLATGEPAAARPRRRGKRRRRST